MSFKTSLLSSEYRNQLLANIPSPEYRREVLALHNQGTALYAKKANWDENDEEKFNNIIVKIQIAAEFVKDLKAMFSDEPMEYDFSIPIELKDSIRVSTANRIINELSDLPGFVEADYIHEAGEHTSEHIFYFAGDKFHEIYIHTKIANIFAKNFPDSITNKQHIELSLFISKLEKIIELEQTSSEKAAALKQDIVEKINKELQSKSDEEDEGLEADNVPEAAQTSKTHPTHVHHEARTIAPKSASLSNVTSLDAEVAAPQALRPLPAHARVMASHGVGTIAPKSASLDSVPSLTDSGFASRNPSEESSRNASQGSSRIDTPINEHDDN